MKDYGLIVNDPASWARVRAAAAVDKSAALKALEGTVAEFGAPIVWTHVRDYSGVVTGLSPLHRVGVQIGADLFTTCGEVIPNDPSRWLPLSPALVRTLADRCKHCEAERAHHITEIAA